MTNVEHFLKRLLAICIYSFENFLLRSAAHFLSETVFLFFFCLYFVSLDIILTQIWS